MVPVVEYIKQPVVNVLDQPDNEINMDNNYSDNEVPMNEEDDLSECTQLLSIVEEIRDIDNALGSDNPSNITDLKTQYVLLPEDGKYNMLKISDYNGRRELVYYRYGVDEWHIH